jgi:hypothetical protein
MIQNPFDDGLDLAGVQGVPIEAYSRFGEFAPIKRLRPGQVVLDLGANIAASLVADGVGIAFGACCRDSSPCQINGFSGA